jgi:hypothetical protein
LADLIGRGILGKVRFAEESVSTGNWVMALLFLSTSDANCLMEFRRKNLNEVRRGIPVRKNLPNPKFPNGIYDGNSLLAIFSPLDLTQWFSY